MLLNYIKIALRTLYKQKGYAFINILGLSIGLACFILISLFVQFELSYDTFHEKADRIYRIVEESPKASYLGSNQFAVTPGPMVDALMSDFPEVEYATQIITGNSLIEHQGKQFYEDGIFATKHFFDVFSFRLVHGDPNTALNDPGSIVLTESLAQKYFSDTDVVGRIVRITHSNPHGMGAIEMRVSGVVEDAPANSHIAFDYIAPFASSEMLMRNIEDWGTSTSLTYASLRADQSIPDFSAKLVALGKKYTNQDEENVEASQANFYFPQPLKDIHLRSQASFELGINGDIKYIYLFASIAFLILLIACINYINLATARSTTRAMEVGVRKVMGADRGQLIRQFLSEAILPAILALVIGMMLVNMFLPTFNELIAREIVMDISQNGGFIIVLLLVGLGVGVLAGGYPALMMSAFDPVRMMKGILNRSVGKTTLRNTLVVVQFTITIALTIGTIAIQRQLHFIQNASLGIDRDQVISIEIKDERLYEQYAALKQAIGSHSSVLGVTASESDPTQMNMRAFTTQWEGVQEGEKAAAYFTPIHYGFVDLLGIDLVEGRDLSETRATDAQEGMLINEAMKRQLGWDTAVGKSISLLSREARVVGVMKDFHFLSFRHEIAPLALFIDESYFQRVLVKVRPAGMQTTIAFLGETMATFSHGYPFEYHFLDDSYNQMYQTETRLGTLLNYFTFLALFIACLGLLGLATFTARQRTREIGVRKVLGASLTDILVLLSKDFTRLILIAFVVAAPIGYFMLNRWLQEFAYHIPIEWSLFAITGGAVLSIAWLTVSYQAMRVALADPVKSLRHE
ncbi:MAG: ABC transporter permease [Rhodothermales bacterium]